jgi:hypothetical protein
VSPAFLSIRSKTAFIEMGLRLRAPASGSGGPPGGAADLAQGRHRFWILRQLHRLVANQANIPSTLVTRLHDPQALLPGLVWRGRKVGFLLSVK